MHPKNIFNTGPMATLLGFLLLLAGPCQIVQGGLLQRENTALLERGVERSARVVSLADGEALKAGAPKVGTERCRWVVEADGHRCSQVFPLPCPADVAETPMLYLPDDPNVCRVLNATAVRADEEAVRRQRTGSGLTAVAIALLLFGRWKARRPKAQLEA